MKMVRKMLRFPTPLVERIQWAADAASKASGEPVNFSFAVRALLTVALDQYDVNRINEMKAAVEADSE